MSGANAIFGSDVVECGMPFIQTTWDNKGQRIGKLKCTAGSYALHVIAELIGFARLLILLAVLGFPAWEWLAAGAFWVLAPAGVGAAPRHVPGRHAPQPTRRDTSECSRTGVCTGGL